MIRTNLKLRASAKDCPSCMSCGHANHDGQQLCLAHSNELAHGRGAYHKSLDVFGAVLCGPCHYDVDKNPKLTKEEKREKHRIAHERTLKWWWTEGYLVAVKPKGRV